MKKLIRNICLLVLALSMVIGMAGCDFIVDLGDYPDNSTTTPPAYVQKIVDQPLANSLTLAQNVDITTKRAQGATPMSMEDAIASVSRSAVAISVEPKGGDYVGWASGVLIDEETGSDFEFYILTCFHVIREVESKVTVYLPDPNCRYDNDNNYIFDGYIGLDGQPGQEVSLVGGDEQSDLAVLKLKLPQSAVAIANDIKNNCLAPIMDPSNSLRVGEQVFAIGNSRGQLPGHTSTGTVSYINRQISVEGRKMTLLEIDVNSYHGNSGGGLYNLYGELVGLTNSGFDDTMGINFAIPLSNSPVLSNDCGVINVVEQLIATHTSYNYGYISGRRLMLGFTVTEENSQVTVTKIDEYGPAYKAGVRLNDVITAVTYKELGEDVTDPVKTNNDFSSVASRMKLLEEFTITVSRKNGRRTETKDITLMYTQLYFCNTGVYQAPQV